MSSLRLCVLSTQRALSIMVALAALPPPTPSSSSSPCSPCSSSRPQPSTLDPQPLPPAPSPQGVHPAAEMRARSVQRPRSLPGTAQPAVLLRLALHRTDLLTLCRRVRRDAPLPAALMTPVCCAVVCMPPRPLLVLPCAPSHQPVLLAPPPPEGFSARHRPAADHNVVTSSLRTRPGTRGTRPAARCRGAVSTSSSTTRSRASGRPWQRAARALSSHPIPSHPNAAYVLRSAWLR